MNRALGIKNWSDGANNYILKGNPKNKWVGFQETVISQLIEKYGDKFYIVIWTDEEDEDDYYCIPYSIIKHLFAEEHKTTGKYPNRWTAIVLDNKFLMHSNSELSVDIEKYYGKPIINEPNIEVQDDFFIENAKAEINVRLGQSKFRKGVLNNYGNKCALTEISEPTLLTASHIIPWAHKKEYRADISNGICLYVEYDALFDKGFITFSDELETIIATDLTPLSRELRNRLIAIKGKKLRPTKKQDLKIDYLKYHRNIIFNG